MEEKGVKKRKENDERYARKCLVEDGRKVGSKLKILGLKVNSLANELGKCQENLRFL